MTKLHTIAIISLGTLIPYTQAFGFGIEAKGIWSHGQPVHETITQRAAVDSGIFTSSDFIGRNKNKDLSSSQQLAMEYLLQGVRFNDDPEGYLMEGTKAHDSGNPVIGFGSEFLGRDKGKREDDPTKSSHFGNYQYLHAMGSAGISRTEIKGKIDRYIYHCWKMATEPNSFEKFKQDYDVVVKQLVAPDVYTSLTPDQIIVRKTIMLFPKEVLFFHATNQEQFQYRALGSLLHVIQDSYAKGHVVREGWEEGDNSGDIRYFQDYGQQESAAHSDLDKFHGGKLSGDNFLEIPGAQMAYERTKQIMSMVNAGCPWTKADIVPGSKCTQSVYGVVRNEIFAFATSNNDETSVTHAHPDLLKKPRTNFASGGPRSGVR